MTDVHQKTSESISGHGYDPETKGMWVRFRANGAVYLYDDVKPEEYDAFVNAKQLGTHFNANFRKRDSKKQEAVKA